MRIHVSQPSPHHRRIARRGSGGDGLPSRGRLAGAPRCSGWMGRAPFRRVARPERHVVPTLGSKEAIFSFAQVVLDLPRGRDTVVVTEPGYPVGVRGAQFAGARVEELPLLKANGFRPGPGRDSPPNLAESRPRVGRLPQQSHGSNCPARVLRATRSARPRARVRSRLGRGVLRALVRRAARLGPRAPRLDDVAVFDTLSKRSSITGYRSGVVAGDPELVAALKQFRPTSAPPRRSPSNGRRSRRGATRSTSSGRGLHTPASGRCSWTCCAHGVRKWRRPTTDVFWVATPAGETLEGFAARLLDHGVPGRARLVPRRLGKGYVRFALVPTDDECARASNPRPGCHGLLPHAVPEFGRSEPMELARRSTRCGRRARSTLPSSSAPIGLSTRGDPVAEPEAHGWRMNEWVERRSSSTSASARSSQWTWEAARFLDKMPVKSDYANRGVRVVPPGVARYDGSLRRLRLMPGYMNIGASVGPRTMVDTWPPSAVCASGPTSTSQAGSGSAGC